MALDVDAVPVSGRWFKHVPVARRPCRSATRGRTTAGSGATVVDALYLADEGWAGLLAPSAARPEYLVLCLFRERDELVPGCVPLSPPERVHDPPAPPTGMTT